jgi:hypothetical protein
MKKSYSITLFFLVFLHLNLVGQSVPRRLERGNLKLIEGVWTGISESGERIELNLVFDQIYYQKGDFLVDQIVGDGFLRSNSNSVAKKVFFIKGVDELDESKPVFLKFRCFDIVKDKYIEGHFTLESLESDFGELIFKNKETLIINGEVDGKKWDRKFSFPSTWTLIKTK